VLIGDAIIVMQVYRDQPMPKSIEWPEITWIHISVSGIITKAEVPVGILRENPRDKGKIIAAHILESDPDRISFQIGKKRLQ
jgi:hypothetical protein